MGGKMSPMKVDVRHVDDIIIVDLEGRLYVNIGSDKEQPVDEDTLRLRVAAVLRNKPKTPIMVRGDKSVDYGKVVDAMVLVQGAGAPSVGLITESPEN